jgi:hypothetical protein
MATFVRTEPADPVSERPEPVALEPLRMAPGRRPALPVDRSCGAVTKPIPSARCRPGISHYERTTKGRTMTATAHEIAETLNRAFDEPAMTMPILLADVIPALAELDQDATSAADPDGYRDRIVLYDGSIILYDSRTERWTVSSTEEVAASDQRRMTSSP